jgi:cyclopropane-fatty-acyl-phospholipid synthase
MLALTCRRAAIRNGQSIMDLGCGWGSLSFYLAEKFPDSKIMAVSNSQSQIEFIRTCARERGFYNLKAIQGDVVNFEPASEFDRIVSIEMLEHIRNWKVLFARVASWLKREGRFFCHFFCHRDIPYLFRSASADDWMGHYFFRGGTMPSFSLPERINKDLVMEESWQVNGRHYSRTLDSWLVNLDERKDEIMPVLTDHYGPQNALLWFRRWRIFLLACSELFAYNRGDEWFVAHYLMKASKEH